MRRRRRPSQDITFSFDSFLDIVANVVGIIIRLILVVWVGARSYSSVQSLHLPAEPAPAAAPALPPLPPDPLQDEIARHRRELEEAQARLLEQMRQLQATQAQRATTEVELAALAARRRLLDEEKNALVQTTTARYHDAQAAALSLEELRQRSQRLAEEIRALEKLPPLRKTHHYRTPISRPVHSEELLFECKGGRVAFIDIAALIGEVRRGLEDRAERLKTSWQISDIAGPVGPFRLRYVLERERGMLDAALGGLTPEANATFRYGLSEWVVEPVALERGEPADRALAAGSEFRQIVDVLDPQQSVVTFWVYPDSFAAFRRLRDYLYDRDIVVAGRPLPDGVPIASSRRGSASRGQ